jgi:hypothetical protein
MNLHTVLNFLKEACGHYPVPTIFAVAGLGALIFIIVDAHCLKKRRRCRRGRPHRQHK